MANENKLGPKEKILAVLILGEMADSVVTLGSLLKDDPEGTKLTINLARDLNAFLGHLGGNITEVEAVLDIAEEQNKDAK